MTELLQAVGKADEAGRSLVERYLDNANRIRQFIKAAKESKPGGPPKEKPMPKKRGTSKDTKIDFSGSQLLEKGLLDDVTRFQFAAAETQPD